MPSQQPIMIQVQPQQPKNSGFHPVVVIMFIIVVLLVVGAIFVFLGQFFNPLQSALNGTINITPATNTLHTAETAIDVGFVIFAILFSFIDALYQYYRPNKFLGLVNIVFLFMLGFLWLTIKIPVIAIATGLNIQSIFPTLFAFLNSGYFVAVVAIFLVVGIIFDFTGD